MFLYAIHYSIKKKSPDLDIRTYCAILLKKVFKSFKTNIFIKGTI